MATLDLSAIEALLADDRSRVDSAGYIGEFIASGELGKEVELDDSRLSGKSVEALYTAFKNALGATVKDSNPPQLKITGGGDVVVKKIGKKDDPANQHLFLVNRSAVAAAKAAQAA